MHIDILTPAYQQPAYLERCITSVEQQKPENPSYTLTHYVQNGGGDKTTQCLLDSHQTLHASEVSYQLLYKQEPDTGMYDALNRAFVATSGDIIGHLNCDEQYLPGTLDKVARFFLENPSAMVFTGGVVVCDPHGKYLCSRLPVAPRYWHSRLCHLSIFTCGTFYRRSLIEDLGMYFDIRYKSIGDADLICRILRKKVRIHCARRYFSLFTETGQNLALSETSRREKQKLLAASPVVQVAARPLLILQHRWRKWRAGCYRLNPFTYSVIREDLKREDVRVTQPVAVWKR